jgi:hypothetical protein
MLLYIYIYIYISLQHYLLYLFSHKVYMRIQEQMVKMLNEESWDSIRCNYTDSSFTTTLKQFFVALKNIC